HKRCDLLPLHDLFRPVPHGPIHGVVEVEGVMNTNWLKARQTKYGAYLAVYLIVIIAVLATANWLASTHDKSFDTTSNKRFSLSDQTTKVVRNLKADVNIKYFDQQKNFGTAKDLLDRYNNLSSKLHVEYIDPDKKPSVA